MFCQIVVGLPALYSYTAFAAITSIGVIGLYIRCGDDHIVIVVAVIVFLTPCINITKECASASHHVHVITTITPKNPQQLLSPS